MGKTKIRFLGIVDDLKECRVCKRPTVSRFISDDMKEVVAICPLCATSGEFNIVGDRKSSRGKYVLGRDFYYDVEPVTVWFCRVCGWWSRNPKHPCVKPKGKN